MDEKLTCVVCHSNCAANGGAMCDDCLFVVSEVEHTSFNFILLLAAGSIIVGALIGTVLRWL